MHRMHYTYMHVYSALMSLRSLQVRLCGGSGVEPGQRPEQGIQQQQHREASVLLLLPPSDQRTAWVLQFQPQHKTPVSGFPQSNPATAVAPFVPTLNKT